MNALVASAAMHAFELGDLQARRRAAGVEHRFHTIEDDLSIVVPFAPAEIDEET